jgi:hypothetical protein
MRRIALILSAALVSATPALAAQSCKPVHFAHGASSAIVRGIGEFDATNAPCFSLGVRPGQIVSMRVLNPDGNMAFSIYDVADDVDSYSWRATSPHIRFIVFETLRAPTNPFEVELMVH